MGKTPKPLRILCVGMWGKEFDDLKDQGHIVDRKDFECFPYDLILGPACWRLLPRLMKYLPLALKEARAAKAKRPKRAATD